MKFTATITWSKLIFGFGITIWILILLLITVNHTLSCVDKNGCPRSYCNKDKFKPPYKMLIKKMCPQHAPEL